MIINDKQGVVTKDLLTNIRNWRGEQRHGPGLACPLAQSPGAGLVYQTVLLFWGRTTTVDLGACGLASTGGWITVTLGALVKVGGQVPEGIWARPWVPVVQLEGGQERSQRRCEI